MHGWSEFLRMGFQGAFVALQLRQVQAFLATSDRLEGALPQFRLPCGTDSGKVRLGGEAFDLGLKGSYKLQLGRPVRGVARHQHLRMAVCLIQTLRTLFGLSESQLRRSDGTQESDPVARRPGVV